MRCRICEKEFSIEQANFCPFCGRMLKQFFTTTEQDEFLREHNNVLRAELTEMFNKKFGTQKSVSAIIHRCSRLGLKLPKEIRYEHNYGIRDKAPIGTEIWYHDCIWVKVKEENAHHPKSIFENPCWKRKHYLVWEEANGKVPEGYCIVFLDGDKKNCELSNLYCTPKRNAIMVANPLIFKNESPHTKKTALIWGECYFDNERRKE